MVCMTRLFVLTCLFLGVQCEYKCVCNYHVQRSVYGSASNYNVPIGFLFEFDCGATLPHIHVGKDWAAIIYNNRIGYIKVDQGVHLETCSGPQPTLAISQTLPTTSIPPQPSSSQSTTLTSTLSTSTQTIKPSTILSTTLMPTTTVTTMKPSTRRRTTHAYATPKIPQTTSLAAPLAPHIFHDAHVLAGQYSTTKKVK